MSNPRVLITTSYLEPGSDVEHLLTSEGCEVVFCRPQDRNGDEDALPSVLATVDAVIAGNDAFTEPVLKGAPRLKIIARTGVGYDGVDVEAASMLGIRVCNTPAANQQSVAELTLGLILACARGTVQAAGAVQSGSWRQVSGIEVAGKTLGIIGLGSIGRRVALLANSVGMSVVAFDTAAEDFDVPGYIEMCSLSDLLQRSDFVSIHVALTPETRHLIDKEALALMRPTAYLINTSRGAVISEVDLVEAILQSRLAGAALDVLEDEPPTADHPLRGLPSVVITPHIAGATKEARSRSSRMAAGQVLDFLNGRPVVNVVNLDAVS